LIFFLSIGCVFMLMGLLDDELQVFSRHMRLASGWNLVQIVSWRLPWALGNLENWLNNHFLLNWTISLKFCCFFLDWTNRLKLWDFLLFRVIGWDFANWRLWPLFFDNWERRLFFNYNLWHLFQWSTVLFLGIFRHRVFLVNPRSCATKNLDLRNSGLLALFIWVFEQRVIVISFFRCIILRKTVRWQWFVVHETPIRQGIIWNLFRIFWHSGCLRLIEELL
jgi:hypothetical protein